MSPWEVAGIAVPACLHVCGCAVVPLRLNQAKTSLPRVVSLSEDLAAVAMSDLPQCQRMGIMVAFGSIDEFKG